MKLIDKAAVIAEIDRELESISNASTNFALGRKMELANILSFLNTLEVKEVDLEKEFDNYAKDILACDVQFQPFTHLYNCAKYFYELGIKSQTKDMIEALRTEYEKGRADVIQATEQWLANSWPKYCDNPNIIKAFEENVIKD